MTPTILTIITRVNSEKHSKLEQILATIQADLDHNGYIPFASLTLVHFASFVIIDDPAFETYLVFENNFDGSIDSYLDELIQCAGPGLHEIYGCCVDGPAGTFDATELHTYLRARCLRPNAFHIGNVGRSADQIKQEKSLRVRIQDFLDTMQKSGEANGSPSSVHEKIRRYIQNDPMLAWVIAESRPRQTRAEWVIPRIKIAAFGLVAFLALPLLVIALPIWVLTLRMKERRDLARVRPADLAHTQALVAREDRIGQNHLASVTIVKPGWFRRLTLRVVLWLVNLLARTATKGDLSGIPSIHFAHWSLIDRGRRLLFLSNFDGSWGSYLDDFVDKASTGLTAIWSNTEGFPPTRFLVRDGARNESGFKAFARDTQTRTRLWYSAYPRLTVQNIDRDSLIRESLVKTRDDNAARDCVRLF